MLRLRKFVPPLLVPPLRVCWRYLSTPRARNVYSTHIPILIGLSRMREIKHVLEFGCGYYSTLTFLNAAAFPHLERLQSIENDAAWADTLRKAAKHDQRWSLNLVEGEIGDSVSNLDLEAFDLILIDDSQTSAQRSSTIRAITAKQPQRPWIVIHDYEVKEYRLAARGFKQRYAFRVYNPHTGLLSNKRIDVTRLNRKLKQNSRALEPDDLHGWVTAS